MDPFYDSTGSVFGSVRRENTPLHSSNWCVNPLCGATVPRDGFYGHHSLPKRLQDRQLDQAIKGLGLAPCHDTAAHWRAYMYSWVFT
jgi:hypothetical protein